MQATRGVLAALRGTHRMQCQSGEVVGQGTNLAVTLTAGESTPELWTARGGAWAEPYPLEAPVGENNHLLEQLRDTRTMTGRVLQVH